MNTQLYIPKKIRVGYQNRSDTYTKKLAYVIYWDDKGKLRKEKSWEGWRDQKIKPEEFENKPHSGFVLNKGVLRDGYWGGGHNLCRIYDDRGIEFEISISNLLFILMSTDCLKRGLEGEFVYAWNGTELVLLPTCCEEYKKCTEFTDLQAGKVGVKDLILGAVYESKSQGHYVYLGKHDWLDYESWHRNGLTFHPPYRSKKSEEEIKEQERKFYQIQKDGYNPVEGKKVYIFAGSKNGDIHTFSGLSSFSKRITEVADTRYAGFVDKLKKRKEINFAVKLIDSPLVFKSFNPHKNYYSNDSSKRFFVKKSENSYEEFVVKEAIVTRYNYKSKPQHELVSTTFFIKKTHTIEFLNGELLVKRIGDFEGVVYDPKHYRYRDEYLKQYKWIGEESFKKISLEELEKISFVDVKLDIKVAKLPIEKVIIHN